MAVYTSPGILAPRPIPFNSAQFPPESKEKLGNLLGNAQAAENDRARTNAAREKMKDYVDPTVRTVSFSGADYKAVVFMPLDKRVLQDAIKETKDKIQAAQARQTYLVAVYKEYSELIDYYTELAQFNFAAAEHYASVSDWANEAKSRKAYTEYQYARGQAIMSRDSQAGTDSDRFQLGVTIKAYATELKRMTEAHSKSEQYSRAITLGDVQTITWSTFREKKPVRTFGRVNPKARTRGQRTIAGSLIFTVFDRASLWELLQAHSALANTGVRTQGGVYPSTEGVLVDQLPPFDISIIASNEIGDNSAMVLYGIEIHSEGTTLSIQDMLTENVMQFTAADIDVLRPLGERRILEEPGKVDKYPNAETASNVVSEARKRRSARLDPFI